jgi:MurNAc alpha-1-phosphate uridylyltransferase
MGVSAGLGTRMAPAANGLPKPLVSLGGKALIDHALDRLAEAGVTRAIVNVHYKADLIERHLQKRQTPAVEISDERAALLDTGGGVKKALPSLGAGPFLIHNADSVWIEGVGSNLARLAGAWDEARMDCLMLLAPATASHGYQGRGDLAASAAGSSRSWCRLRSRACRWRIRACSPPARTVPSRSTWCGQGRSPRVALMGCAWMACGCTSARRLRWQKRSGA